MTMATAYDAEFTAYLIAQAETCGATFAPVCAGGIAREFYLDVPNLKYSWVSLPANGTTNQEKVESLVVSDLALYFGVIKSEVTVTASPMAGSTGGTMLTSNMQFPSAEQSDRTLSKLDALAADRRTSDSLTVGSLEVLPPSAKNDPLVGMQTAINVPSKFCSDTSAKSACAAESRDADAISSDQCFASISGYASALTACTPISIGTKADVTVACKTALGGASSCFGLAPVSPSPPPPPPPPPPTAVTVATHVVKMAVSLPMTVDQFNADAQTKFKESIAKAAGATPADVTIDKIQAISVGRRRLLASSIRVDTSVNAADKAAADAMSGKLTADNINAELETVCTLTCLCLGLPQRVSMGVSLRLRVSQSPRALRFLSYGSDVHAVCRICAGWPSSRAGAREANRQCNRYRLRPTHQVFTPLPPHHLIPAPDSEPQRGCC